MIKNYLLLFFRSLKRQKLFSTINLLGLTVSMVSTLLIYLYVSHEFSYDRFHHDADRVYRVNQTFIWGENSNNQFGSTGPGVATALHAELPEVELMTSIHTPGNFIVSYTNPAKEVISFEEDKVLAADTNFFRMFNFPMIQGDPNSALRQANTVVMTESTAKKYFGDDNAVGKLVRLGGLTAEKEPVTYEVTAVVKDTPSNSYIEYDMLLSMNSFPVIRRLHWSWIWTQLETYLRVAPGTDIGNTRAKLAKIPRKYAEETLQRTMNTTFDDYIKSGKKWELFLQPLTGIHLPPELVFGRLNDSGNIKIIYSFIGAAVFIILLSCINFMNLSMAQFTRRIKEASVRKIMGLGRKELSMGYFVEAMIFCALALFVAIGLAQLLLPGFNYIIGKQLEFHLLQDPKLMASLVGLCIFMAAASSIYPAVFLSSFHPVEGIKGKTKAGKDGKLFRNSLVVFQFCVSIILIVCTSVVFQQLNYVSQKDLGFDKENLLVIEHVEGMKNRESFASAARNIGGVVNASWCSSVPPQIYGGDSFSAEGMDDKTFPLNFTMADERYVPTLAIKLKYGRNFSIDNPADADRVLLNETAIARIGWKLDESTIGKKLRYDGREYEVIGIMSNFNYWSLDTAIEPLGIFHIKGPMRDQEKQFLTLRMSGDGIKSWENSLAALEAVWKKHAGDVPFQYKFVDQTFAETFRSQQQFGQVLTVMATLAILIACLGLLGIIIYSLEQRSKEIGIRKVSGATVMNILTLITGGYARLIIAAFVIGAPVAYWMMNLWLSDFAFKITPSPWIFVAAGGGTLLIAIAITGYHSVKAALTNPVTVLRDE